MTTRFNLPFAQQFLEENFAPWIIDLKPKLMICDRWTAKMEIPISPISNALEELSVGKPWAHLPTPVWSLRVLAI